MRFSEPTRRPRRRYALSAAQSSVLVQAVEEANQVLIAIVHGDRQALQAWNSDVDFAAATLAYYQLAILRFRTMGKLWRDPSVQAGPPGPSPVKSSDSMPSQ